MLNKFASFSTGNLISHPHFYRFLIVFPFILIAKYFEISRDYVFTIAVSLVVILIPIILQKVYQEIFEDHSKKWQKITFFSLAYYLLSLVMNGRIIFAHFGIALSILTLILWHKGKINNLVLFLMIIFCVFLSSVSTGTIFVVIFLSLFFVIFTCFSNLYRKKISFKYLFPIVCLIATIAVVFPSLSKLINKNLDFYGGGLTGAINMLSHGFGLIFLIFKNDYFILINFIIILFLFAISGFFFLIRFGYILSLAVSFSFAGGLFGFSTLTMVMPPLLVIVYYWSSLMITRTLKEIRSKKTLPILNET